MGAAGGEDLRQSGFLRYLQLGPGRHAARPMAACSTPTPSVLTTDASFFLHTSGHPCYRRIQRRWGRAPAATLPCPLTSISTLLGWIYITPRAEQLWRPTLCVVNIVDEQCAPCSSSPV